MPTERGIVDQRRTAFPALTLVRPSRSEGGEGGDHMGVNPRLRFADEEQDSETCSACGSKDLLPPLEESRARICLACGSIMFPETSEHGA
jgi:hypothetical protein